MDKFITRNTWVESYGRLILYMNFFSQIFKIWFYRDDLSIEGVTYLSFGEQYEFLTTQLIILVGWNQ